MLRITSLWLVVSLVAAHSDHTFDLNDDDAGMSYAERHMHTEHHIDSFDLPSFFKLHDLNQDGYWDEAEIQAVYGLHHHSVTDKMPDPLVAGRADVVVQKVLGKLDKDKDGKISLEEFVAGGTEGLPSFEGYRDLGHHYDEESEYFLHHEELYHSSPETQTDESYTHPEDIQHFKSHGHIEAEEDARERKFEGLPEDADLEKDHVIADPLDEHSHAPGEGPPGDQAQKPFLEAGSEVDGPAKMQRVDPGATPNRLKAGTSGGIDREALKQAAEDAKGKPYEHSHGERPRSAEERLRAGVPYSIGSAVAHAFIRSGCTKLIITDLNPATLEFTSLSLKNLTSRSPLYTTILSIPGDISSPAFVDDLFDQILRKFGRLDYAVNCAGIIGNNLPSDECSIEDFDKVNNVNYRGLFLCSRKELGMMKGQAIREREGYAGERKQRGSIVNIASQLAIVGRPNAPIYCASKSAVIGLTQCDAIDYSQYHIRVNAVCPGIVDTPMTKPQPRSTPTYTSSGDVHMGEEAQSTAPTSRGSGKQMELSQSIGIAPMNRMGTPAEIADVVLFLCSEKASFVQGAAWVVDGGYTIN